MVRFKVRVRVRLLKMDAGQCKIPPKYVYKSVCACVHIGACASKSEMLPARKAILTP